MFNVAGEFIVHAFKAHLKANMPTIDTTENIPHLCTQQWLRDTADMIVKSAVMPTKSMQRPHSFIHFTPPRLPLC